MKHYLLSLLCLLAMPAMAQDYVFPVDTLYYNGPSSECVDLVFLGDGYLESERETFIKHVSRAAERLMSESPFDRYNEYINVYAIFTASNGHIPSRGTGDTYYWCKFYYDGYTQRLLFPSLYNRALDVARENVPGYDSILMSVNSDTYGGGGGGISVFTQTSQGIMLHEFAHTFAAIGDEYQSRYYYESNVNMTKESDPTKVKWKNWIGETNYKNYVGGVVGVYSYGDGKGWYRPTDNACMMSDLGSGWCPVCREALVESIHAKTTPVRSAIPVANSTVTLDRSGAAQCLEVLTRKPNPNSLHFWWEVDGTLLPQHADTLLYLNALNLAAGSHTVTVSVVDTTDYVRVDNHDELHVKQVTWQLEVPSNEDYFTNYVVLSEDNTITADGASDEAQMLILKRSLSQDAWSTLILPVDLTLEQFKDAFGEGAKLAALGDVTTEDGNRYINFNVVNGIYSTLSDGDVCLAANTPYIIYTTAAPKVEKGANYWTLSERITGPAYFINGVTYSYPGETQFYVSNAGNEVTFYGSYANPTIIPSDSYVFTTSGSIVYTTTAHSNVKGYRGWLKENTTLEAAGKLFGRIVDGTQTSIINIETGEQINANSAIYNLSGVKVSNGETNGLARGVYIQGGKKIIVK